MDCEATALRSSISSYHSLMESERLVSKLQHQKCVQSGIALPDRDTEFAKLMRKIGSYEEKIRQLEEAVRGLKESSLERELDLARQRMQEQELSARYYNQRLEGQNLLLYSTIEQMKQEKATLMDFYNSNGTGKLLEFTTELVQCIANNARKSTRSLVNELRQREATLESVAAQRQEDFSPFSLLPQSVKHQEKQACASPALCSLNYQVQSLTKQLAQERAQNERLNERLSFVQRQVQAREQDFKFSAELQAQLHAAKLRSEVLERDCAYLREEMSSAEKAHDAEIECMLREFCECAVDSEKLCNLCAYYADLYQAKDIVSE